MPETDLREVSEGTIEADIAALDQPIGSPEDLEALYDRVSVGGILPWAQQYPPRIGPVKREGFHLTDSRGRTLADAHAGILSMSEGWRNPRHEALIAHFRARFPGIEMVDTTQLFDPAVRLLADLQEMMMPYGGRKRGILASSGSMANDQVEALCMGALGGEGATQLLVMDKQYSGRSLVTNAACFADGWEGLTTLGSLRKKAFVLKRDGSNMNDVFDAIPKGKRPLLRFEDLIQGVAGFHVLDPAFLRAVVEEVHRRGGKVILDDVQAFVRNGFGPIGFDGWGDRKNPLHHPDAVVFAKGLGNGYPIAAAMVSEEVLEACKSAPGNTFDTFSQPLAGIVAARMTVRMVMEEQQWKNADARGTQFHAQTKDFPDRFSGVVEEMVGRGGMVGIRLHSKEQMLAALRAAPDKGIIFAKGGGKDVHVLRVALPFNATEAFVNEVVEKLAAVMAHVKDSGIA